MCSDNEGGKMLPIKPGNLAIIHQQFPGVEMRKLEVIQNVDELPVNQHSTHDSTVSSNINVWEVG